MNNDKDYLNNFEEHRQEVGLDEIRRRRTRTRSKKKKEKSPLLTILVLIFILIPAGLLVYVWKYYEPTSPTEKAEIDNSVTKFETNKDFTSVVDDGKDDEEEKSNSSASNGSSEDVNVSKEEAEKLAQAAKIAEEKLKQEQAKKAEEEAKKKAEEEAKKKAEAEAEAKRKAEEEAKRKAEEDAKKKAEQNATAKKHIVHEKETLYSIAMKYYKDPSMVDKIRQANNLPDNNIRIGMTLILP